MFVPTVYKNTSDKDVSSFKEALEVFRHPQTNTPWGFPVEKTSSYAMLEEQLVKIPNVMHTYRPDTNKILGTVGNDYGVITPLNSDLVKVMEGVFEATKAKAFNAGEFGGGSKQFMQAKMGDPMILKRNGTPVTNGEIQRNWNFINSYDGSTSIVLGSGNTVVVCLNTFLAAFRESKQELQVKHTKHAGHFFRKPEQIVQGLLVYQNKVEQVAIKLVQSEFTDAMMDNVLRNISHIPESMQLDDIPKRTLNVWDKVKTYFQSGIGIDQTNRGTGWAALSALTQYSTHEIGVKVSAPSNFSEQEKEMYKSENEDLVRFESNLIGNASQFARQALDAVMFEVSLNA